MADMDLNKAIAEARRMADEHGPWSTDDFVYGWEDAWPEAGAAILNAVCDGRLVQAPGPASDAAQIADAYRRGQEDMRERAVSEVVAASNRCEDKCRMFGGMPGRERDFDHWSARGQSCDTQASLIRALPIKEDNDDA